jgi:hypothetical protein
MEAGVKELKEKGGRSQRGKNKKEAGDKEVKLKGGRNQRGRRKVRRRRMQEDRRMERKVNTV